MRCFALALCLVLAWFAFGGTPSAIAQEQDEMKQAMDAAQKLALNPDAQKRMEDLFLLYNLADMYRNFWPEVRENQSSAIRGLQVSVSMASRKLITDQLLLRMKKIKADEAMIQMYRDFKGLLDGTQADFDQVDAVARTKADQIEPRGDNNFSRSAFMRGFSLYLDRGEAGEKTIYENMTTKKSQAAPARGRGNAANAKAAKLEKLESDTDVQREAIRQKQSKKKDELVAKAEVEAKRLAERKGWNPAEAIFNFTTGKPQFAPGDPFPIVEMARIPFDTTQGDPMEGYLKRAKACFQAALLMLPQAKEYDFFRAEFFSDAGKLANIGSFQATGRAGFIAAKGLNLPTAKLAVQAWGLYRRYESLDIDANFIIRHQCLLAMAYAARYPDAFNMFIESALTSQLPPSRRGGGPGLGTNAALASAVISLNPTFWYNGARVCALANRTDAGFVCLEQAMILHFKGLEDAVVSPDLAALRKKDPDYFTELMGINDMSRFKLKYHEKMAEAAKKGQIAAPKKKR